MELKICIFMISFSGWILASDDVMNAKVFTEHRKQQQLLIKDMMSFKYEKNHKLLKTGYLKIFQLLEQNNETLIKSNYHILQDGFDQSQPIQEALTLLLENCCLVGEFLLHFPEISYHVFRNKLFINWRQKLNWCTSFVNAFPDIIDESSASLMDLLQQEINPELRTSNYVNPYYSKTFENSSPSIKKKKTKKFQKGPQLASARHEL